MARQQGNEIADTYIQMWYNPSSHLYNVRIVGCIGYESETVHRAV